jgi:hypothetical protein
LGQAVVAFASVELGENASAVNLAIDIRYNPGNDYAVGPLRELRGSIADSSREMNDENSQCETY